MQEMLMELHDVPFINSGGCGISALSIYRWLKKNGQLNSKTRFVYLYNKDCKNLYINNKAALRKKFYLFSLEIKPTSALHVGIFHNGKYIDCDGDFDVTGYDFIQLIKDEDFVVNSINNKSAWNDLFDRKHINLIESLLDIDLSDIKIVS